VSASINLGSGGASPAPIPQYACEADVALGDVVYQISSVSKKVGKALSGNAAKTPPIGIITSKTGFNVSLSASGTVAAGLSGLTLGQVYYLSDATAGALTTTAPASAGWQIGVAVSATELLVNIAPVAGTTTATTASKSIAFSLIFG
jgi:hypothetical protein